MLDRIVGVDHKLVIILDRAVEALTRIVRLVMDFVIIHAVIVPHVQPVDSGKNVLPPLVPILWRVRWIQVRFRPGRFNIVIYIAHRQYRADASSLQIGEDRTSVALPSGSRFARPVVVAAVGWRRHDAVPPGPVDQVRVGLDLVDRR